MKTYNEADHWAEKLGSYLVVYLIKGDHFIMTKSVRVKDASPEVLKKQLPENTYAFQTKELVVKNRLKLTFCYWSTFHIDGSVTQRTFIKAEETPARTP